MHLIWPGRLLRIFHKWTSGRGRVGQTSQDVQRSPSNIPGSLSLEENGTKAWFAMSYRL